MSNNNEPKTNEPDAAAIAASKDIKLDARVFPVKEPKNSVIAFASLTVGGCFAVNGIKLIDGEKGIFVAMPSSKDARGGYRDTCFPVTAELRNRINETVLSGYEAEIGKGLSERESLMGRIKDAVKTAKETPAPAPSPGIDKTKTAAPAH